MFVMIPMPPPNQSLGAYFDGRKPDCKQFEESELHRPDNLLQIQGASFDKLRTR
jgi:hypothetical protein